MLQSLCYNGGAQKLQTYKLSSLRAALLVKHGCQFLSTCLLNADSWLKMGREVSLFYYEITRGWHLNNGTQ